MGGGGGGGGVSVGWALDIGAAASLHLTTNSTISPGVESTKHSGEKRIGIPFSRRLGTVERADTDISHFRRRCAAESVSVWLALPYVSAPLTSNY